MNKINFNIRPIEFEDASVIYEWKNNPQIFKYLGGGYKPQSLTEIQCYMNSLLKQTESNQRFLIVNEERQIPVGLVGLYNIKQIHGTCEIGIYIGNKEFQGKGAGSIAVKKIEYYAKNFLNLRKISLFVVSNNISAVRFWEKMEYCLVGTLNKERYIDGQYMDVQIREKFL
ncbi:GNAT family N-acetyltransferase [Enterococcus faecium]|nr:GNAT family N-acetyltransferase [Enterococcus faecium]